MADVFTLDELIAICKRYHINVVEVREFVDNERIRIKNDAELYGEEDGEDNAEPDLEPVAEPEPNLLVEDNRPVNIPVAEVVVEEANTKNVKDSVIENIGSKKGRKQVDLNELKEFDGTIDNNCCQAVILNSNLFTQCMNKPVFGRNTCSKADCKKFKYGNIVDRAKAKKGAYICPTTGKKEKAISKVLKDLNKRHAEVEKNKRRVEVADTASNTTEKDKNENVEKDGEKEVKTSESSVDADEDLEVSQIEIDGVKYLIDKNGMMYNFITHDPLGEYEDDPVKIQEIFATD